MALRIAGAGVAGLCAAFELAKLGREVVVYDRVSGLDANQCSRFAGGMLAPWCERASAEEEVITLGLQAFAFWQSVTDVTHKGTLVVASEDQSPLLRAFANATRSYETADIAALEPQLKAQFADGLFFADEAHMDPRQALRDLAAKCRDLGVDMRFGTPAPERFDVDCTGMAAAKHLPDLRPIRGEMLIVRCPGVEITRTVRFLHDTHPVYIVPRGEGVYMLGATMIESDDHSPIRDEARDQLLAGLRALHPGFEEAVILETGVGLRPTFPNQLPQVRKQGDTWYVNGMYRHGFLMAPAMARQLVRFMFPETVEKKAG